MKVKQPSTSHFNSSADCTGMLPPHYTPMLSDYQSTHNLHQSPDLRLSDMKQRKSLGATTVRLKKKMNSNAPSVKK